MKYKNVALITGGCSGIGKELAKIHAWRTNDLVLVSNNQIRLEQTKKEIENEFKVKVYLIVKDLSLPNAANEIYQEIKDENIKVEYLINNAGFTIQGSFHRMEWNEQLKIINVSIITLTTLTKLFLDDMAKTNEGKILNISSIAGLFPGGPLQSIYFASKSYIASFSNGLAYETRNSNITVTCAIPVATKTNFASNAKIEKTKMFKKPANAKRVAVHAYDGMIKGKINVYCGINWLQIAGYQFVIRFLPKKLNLWIIDYLNQKN